MAVTGTAANSTVRGRRSAAARAASPTPLRDLVAVTVDLNEENGRWRGACNLHPDRARGLYVDRGRNVYHCFSCGRYGDVVRWTMELEGIDKATAINLLLGWLRPPKDDRPAPEE